MRSARLCTTTGHLSSMPSIEPLRTSPWQTETVPDSAIGTQLFTCTALTATAMPVALELIASIGYKIVEHAGYATAAETNRRFRYLIEHGSTGLSMAFDLPTQLGRDSDDPLCHGEVGRTGVAIDTIDDMRRVFEGIPLDEVTTSMTINAPAAVLLLLYELVGEEQGVAAKALTGTIQNDILKEYIARGTYIYPP